MAKVIITEDLFKEIKKRFDTAQANEVIDLIETLEENPKKGKELAHVGKTLIKELKYNKFRFYFITDGFKVRFLSIEELKDLLIKFIRMSEKKDQQKVIEDIKDAIRKLGEEGF